MQNELSDDTHCQSGYTDYISFQVPDEAFPDIPNCIGIAKGFKQKANKEKNGYTCLEAVLLSVPNGYHCVDLSLYKVKTQFLSIIPCHLCVCVCLSLSSLLNPV